jgi:hypothetical protein
MLVDEVHEIDGVVRVGHGKRVVAKREPTNSPVVILHKFTVSFFALLFAENERLARPAGDARLLFEVFEVVGAAVRPSPVGSPGGFDLQNSEVDAHLNDLSGVGRLHQTGLDYAGLKVPPSKGSVNVLLHGLLALKMKDQ